MDFTYLKTNSNTTVWSVNFSDDHLGIMQIMRFSNKAIELNMF